MAAQSQIREAEPPTALFKIANPLMKLVLRSPLNGMLADDLILLRWRGHKSGNEYTTPVGYKQDGDRLTVFTFSGWKANFRTPHPVEVKLRGDWRQGTGIMEDDPRKAAEYIKRSVEDSGPEAYRRFRMEVEGEPTVEELIPEVEKRNMVLIYIDLEG